MDGHIMHGPTIGSCQSAASSKIVKLLVTSLIHVSGAIASVQTFTFTNVCSAQSHFVWLVFVRHQRCQWMTSAETSLAFKHCSASRKMLRRTWWPCFSRSRYYVINKTKVK